MCMKCFVVPPKSRLIPFCPLFLNTKRNIHPILMQYITCRLVTKSFFRFP